MFRVPLEVRGTSLVASFTVLCKGCWKLCKESYYAAVRSSNRGAADRSLRGFQRVGGGEPNVLGRFAVVSVWSRAVVEQWGLNYHQPFALLMILVDVGLSPIEADF